MCFTVELSRSESAAKTDEQMEERALTDAKEMFSMHKRAWPYREEAERIRGREHERRTG